MTIDLFGEFDTTTEQLTGVWVVFAASWRLPALWADIGRLGQTLENAKHACPEFTAEKIQSVQLGEHVVFDGTFPYEVLNALGSPLR